MGSSPESASLAPVHRRLLERFREGRERALARAISLVEDETPGFETLLDLLHEDVGRARRVGITGPPGAGKSTLTARLARRYRDRDLRVGILAADPTSAFTGGALLGDRIRMGDLATDPGIFIRSMASRGTAGGLAAASREAADLMDAFGFGRVILETVGVGQGEIEVATSADTTAVVLVPESGDGVQAMKAGLMEVADVFVVNKADRPGADRLKREISVMLRIRGDAVRGRRSAGGDRGETADAGPRPAADAGEAAAEPWTPPIVPCVATEGEGIPEVEAALDDHFAHLRSSGDLARRRRRQLREQARRVLFRRSERAARRAWEEGIGRFAEDLDAGRLSPYRVARKIAEASAGSRPG